MNQEEKQRGIATRQVLIEPAAMAMQYSCNNGNGRSTERKLLHCSYCDHDHHTSDTCWKLYGYSLGHRLHGTFLETDDGDCKKKTKGSSSNGGGSPLANNIHSTGRTDVMPILSQEQFQQLLLMMSQKLGLESKANAVTGACRISDEWILDSGAINHVYCLPLAQATFKPSLPPVGLPDGTKVPINFVGNCNIPRIYYSRREIFGKKICCAYVFKRFSYEGSERHCEFVSFFGLPLETQMNF